MALTIGIHRIRVLLRLQQARQLPAHHAALVYAVLAEAYGLAGDEQSVLPDGVMVEAPEQCRIRVLPGETYALGFTLLSGSPREAQRVTERLVRGLERLADRSDSFATLGGNYQVAAVKDLVAGQDWSSGKPPAAMCIDRIRAEAARLAEHDWLTLDWTTPLRAHRPRGKRRPGHAFLDDQYFDMNSIGRISRHSG